MVVIVVRSSKSGVERGGLWWWWWWDGGGGGRGDGERGCGGRPIAGLGRAPSACPTHLRTVSAAPASALCALAPFARLVGTPPPTLSRFFLLRWHCCLLVGECC
jgi:hypothetical protein